jgi:hypothetical protein
LADNNPIKQGHHLFARTKKILRFRKNIFQQDAVVEPTPQEDEDKCGNERDDESFH